MSDVLDVVLLASSVSTNDELDQAGDEIGDELDETPGSKHSTICFTGEIEITADSNIRFVILVYFVGGLALL